MAEKKTINHKPPAKKQPPVKRQPKKQSKQPQPNVKKVEVKIDLNKLFSKGLIYIILGLLFVPFLIQLFSGGSYEQISISQLVRDIREEKVEKLDVAGQQLRAHYGENDQVKIARKEEGQ
ncbi:hypothetical protein KKE34_04885, partial [Patescibacteria group bacterium]|nr:hypothetical protein [Patescibacteria group bacterium]